jgi:E3 ubiquitin-protein ligase RNF213
MQGTNKNENNIFNSLKEAHLITFQCSPLSTSEMIIKTFRYCSKYQLERRADLDKYVSVVVLDEIGLAEASKSMPLKSLHPLLEDGVYYELNEEANLPKDIKTNEWRKIGFIGISSWVLDPAKMNRGIFVNRCSPDLNELKDIATGICKNDQTVIKIIDSYLPALADGFLNICNSSQEKHREFFGLRDFYSLIKMIYYEIKLNKGLLDGNFFQKSIRRNFGGLPELNSLSLFLNEFNKYKLAISFDLQQSTSIIELIRQALDRKSTEYDNRYLLLIAQNENALDILKHYILHDIIDSKNIKIIFGSSFPNEQSYSQICRQIHQIKLCMETGKTVILLNLETLYESLYDALNQFYYRFGDNDKFVDLGLGTQRVKCLVHDNFRLIVVSDKKNVYNSNKFPIPLVNRLEKHCLSMELVLDDKKLEIVREIQIWLKQICNITKLKLGDIFIGYTQDTLSSLVLKMCNDNNFNFDDYYEWCDNKQSILDKTRISYTMFNI